MMKNTAHPFDRQVYNLRRMGDRLHSLPASPSKVSGPAAVRIGEVRPPVDPRHTGDEHTRGAEMREILVHAGREGLRGLGELRLVHASEHAGLSSHAAAVAARSEFRLVQADVASALEASAVKAAAMAPVIVHSPDSRIEGHAASATSREAVPIDRLMAWQAMVELAASIGHVCVHEAVAVWRDPALDGRGFFYRIRVFWGRCRTAVRRDLTGTAQDVALAALAEPLGHDLLPAVGRVRRIWLRLRRLLHHALVPLGKAFRLVTVPDAWQGKRRSADLALKLLLSALATLLLIALEEALESLLPLGHPFGGHLLVVSAIMSGVCWLLINKLVTRWDPFHVRAEGEVGGIIARSAALRARGQSMLAAMDRPPPIAGSV